MSLRLSIRTRRRGGSIHLWQSDAAECIVGRSAGADLVLPDGRISGRHLRIAHDPGQGLYLAEDLGSTNGSRLNGHRLRPAAPRPLQTGDELEVGRVLLRVEAVTAPLSPTPLGPPPASPELTERRLAAELPLERPARPWDPLWSRLRRWERSQGATLDRIEVALALAAAALLLSLLSSAR